LDETKKLEAEYNIINFENFAEGLEFKVKKEKFSPYAVHNQQLPLSDDMIHGPQEL
jgi:hypothetical protein